jgi:hypothetical protein
MTNKMFWVVMPCSSDIRPDLTREVGPASRLLLLIFSLTLMMETICSFEMSGCLRDTQHSIQKTVFFTDIGKKGKVVLLLN